MCVQHRQTVFDRELSAASWETFVCVCMGGTMSDRLGTS